MFEKLTANFLFEGLLRRHNINKAYAMVGPEDSWYNTIITVHNSLAEIRQNPHEEWKIVSHDNLRLKAVYYPGRTDKTMIWVHGYTSHAERESAFPALFYHSMGYNVLVPYLRAHGPSDGRYITFGALEYRDMLLWVEEVNKRHSAGSIVIHGLSMGAGIVLDLASQEMKNVKCLISDAPVEDIERTLKMFCSGSVRKNAERIGECFMAKFQKKFSTDTTQFDRLKNSPAFRYPLLLSAGSMEGHEELLYKLKENSPCETTVVILPGCNHGNGMYKQTEMYQGAIRTFLEQNM